MSNNSEVTPVRPEVYHIGLSPETSRVLEESNVREAVTPIGFRMRMAYAAMVALHDGDLWCEPWVMQWVFYRTIKGDEIETLSGHRNPNDHARAILDFAPNARRLDSRDWKQIYNETLAWSNCFELAERYEREAVVPWRMARRKPW